MAVRWRGQNGVRAGALLQAHHRADFRELGQLFSSGQRKRRQGDVLPVELLLRRVEFFFRWNGERLVERINRAGARDILSSTQAGDTWPRLGDFIAIAERSAVVPADRARA